MSAARSALFRLASSRRFERATRALPVGEAAAWRAASRYVAGTDLAAARRIAERLADRGVSCSIDQFGELVADASVAERVAADYCRLAAELSTFPDSTWLSIDLSHLGLDIAPGECADRLAAIAAALPERRRIQVGAEDRTRTDAVLSCVLNVAGRGLADRLGATVQANLRRSPADLEQLIASGVHVRLVKGAFVEPAQHALEYGEPTDLAYLRLAPTLADAGAPFALGTHDGVLREALLAFLGPLPVEQLLGVRPETLAGLTARGVPVRVYVPYGHDWFRYWMRRVAEARGA